MEQIKTHPKRNQDNTNKKQLKIPKNQRISEQTRDCNNCRAKNASSDLESENEGSKKYTTYLGLVDSRASGSLVNKELVEFADFEMKLQKKPTKRDTAIRVFQTD